MLGILIFHDCTELCKFVQNIWLMSEACEIAQLLDLKLWSVLFIYQSNLLLCNSANKEYQL